MRPERIILIRPDRLGDLILSLPVARALKDRFPHSHIAYLAAQGPAEIAPMVSYVDDWILDQGENGRLSLPELTGIMRKGKFDKLIELKPGWRTATAGFLSGIPIRIGTGRRFYSIFYNRRANLHRKGSGKHQSDLDLAMLGPLGIDINGLLPEMILPDSFKILAGKLVGENTKEYIVIHPGSGGSAPNWPVNSYKELAQLIMKDTKFKIIITGLEKKLSDFDGCIDLSRKTTLAELAGVLGGANLFISGSTGPLHLADTLGTKCLSFFVNRSDIGPTRWGPRRNLRNVMIPEGDLCKCNNSRQCHCMEQITPLAAFNKVMMVLNNKVGGTAVVS
jgi:ADP-heptose:LPS heptosyltransferase